MANFYARTSDQVEEFLENSQPGDTIYLAPGTYDKIALRNAGHLDVTLTSMDPDDQAVITGLNITGADGLRFSNLSFIGGEGDTNCFTISGSNAIVFSNVTVQGPDNIGSGEEVSPFFIRSSTDVTVINSDFSNAMHALKLLDVDGVVISGNSFHDIRCDGIRGGGVSNAIVTNNTFTDFHPLNTGGSGDHPDAIQFWSTNQNEPGRNITISDNLVYRGDGSPIQGIFIRDTRDNMPFENVNVSGNVILGGLYNGISVDGVIGGEVTQNLVLGYPDQRSFLRVIMEHEYSVRGNASTSYAFATRDSAHLDNNESVDESSDFAQTVFAQWQQSGSTNVSELAQMLLQAAPIEGFETSSQADPNASVANAAETLGEILGSWNGETLHASETGSKVFGKGGDDLIEGSEYGDLLFGNLGDDRLFGHDGNDVIRGAGGNDILYGHAGADRLYGGFGDDQLYGGNGADNLFGGRGADILEGGQGNDRLYGGAGNDRLFGGAGDDRIVGGSGSDVMMGGVGADRFIMRDASNGTDGTDTILDFTSGEDIIDVRFLDANTMMEGDQAFTFVGMNAFSGTAGELRYEVGAEGVTLLGDMDGNGVADYQLLLEGIDTIATPDIWF
ncbi:hypothetical protein E3U23_07805 [Erythrobacter litoralis]|uniref:right-handed parallel beta-helix repeat-containing protein n=1 Tax=Erythrobacter litoralis TaxID=39960 RepID=UPI002434E027|nr:right-handed parallel beta-helix repeat-containing protein [Erythrobacter litoralis]MDG6079094.1 hypothetical protein [Erythrobacter litoralis]